MTKHDVTWRKSRHSEPNGACVEVGYVTDGTIRVRDTKQHRQGPILEFTRAEWSAFLDYIRNLSSKG
ncbi:hypothetical protein Acsp03_61830 [Actinomadura sp. NBRC 104412]|uniref:DUF397 domain-containing protein n=1 Tax=Actinomadura sp. NBRC 104412 TaxID=3032203 RepID=UPI0024A3D9FD|nr:DUF397 domain-containing protein [Actinomadura sp. NBRC 104412]GLZ08717.1 hypothetical protein Acsp03_61830 [Actinomadura sp. NBRC 104412]